MRLGFYIFEGPLHESEMFLYDRTALVELIHVSKET